LKASYSYFIGLPSLPPSLLGLGIGVGKGWEAVLKYEIKGRGGKRSYYSRELGEGRGVPKRHTLGTKHGKHNISPGKFWREKSFVLTPVFSLLLLYLFIIYSSCPSFRFFHVFDRHCIIDANFSNVAARSTVTDDVTN